MGIGATLFERLLTAGFPSRSAGHDQRATLQSELKKLRDTIASRSIRNRTAAFGLTIAPLPAANFNALIPGGKRHQELRALINRLYTERLHGIVSLRITGEHLLATVMQPGGNLKLGHGSRLGGKPHHVYTVHVTMMAQ